MRKATVLVIAVCLLFAQSALAANPVRISQVYGGNGNTYNQDYVELYNSSGSDINISGWSLQYGSATGTADLGACTLCLTTLPANTVIKGCSYFLVGLVKGTVGANLPVTPDFEVPSGNNISSTNGKIGLKADANTTPCSPQSAFVDLVGWGSANCSEGTPTPALSATSAALRNNGGMDDTDINSADFTIVTAPATFEPRNSTSPINPLCTPVPVTPVNWSNVKVLYRD